MLFFRKHWPRMLALLLALAGSLATLATFPHPPPALADDDGGGGDDDGGDDGGEDDGGGDDDGGDHDSDGEDAESDDNHSLANGHGDGNDDHEFALRARKRGKLRSLNVILENVRRRYGGRVLEVELERKKGRVWYEIRILDRTDRVRELKVPAIRKHRNFNTGRR